MPYKSEAQRRFLHARHPEIAAKWDAEIRGAKKKRTISKARKDYAGPLEYRRMDDEALGRAKNRQKYFSLTGSGLGITGLSLLGTGAAIKSRNPKQAARLKNMAANTSITAGGVGALSGINFARIQGEESKRAREIKKDNYGAGYSQFSEKDRKKYPFTISRKAADPERSRERRQRVYPVLMGGGAVGTGALTVRAATKESKKIPLTHIDSKILANKPLRVATGTAATGGLAYGAYYNSRKKNRATHDGWYPARER